MKKSIVFALLFIGFCFLGVSSAYASGMPDSTRIEKAAVDTATTTGMNKQELIQSWEYQREEAERELQGSYTKYQRQLQDLIKTYSVQIMTIEALSDSTIKFKKERIK